MLPYIKFFHEKIWQRPGQIGDCRGRRSNLIRYRYREKTINQKISKDPERIARFNNEPEGEEKYR